MPTRLSLQKDGRGGVKMEVELDNQGPIPLTYTFNLSPEDWKRLKREIMALDVGPHTGTKFNLGVD